MDKKNILIAGHDLKFLKMLIDFLKENKDVEVRIDQWKGHNNHDEKYSQKCLEWADIIFCEWGLGNAVWYSKNKKVGQKLYVRMHLQERETDYPKNYELKNIDKIIAISPYIFEEFHKNKRCKIPRDKMQMIYNMIDTKKYDLQKLEDIETRYNIGICGILPSRKRLDRVIDIFEKLWEKNNKYRLFIKSKLPQEVQWLMKREEEKKYYDEVFQKIEKAPWRDNVIFDKHGNDMEEWFRKIGYVLSTSDFESFHLAPMEGMASGSIPVVYHWDGAETIYQDEFVFETADKMAEFILNSEYEGNKLKKYPRRNFDKSVIVKKLYDLIMV